MFSLIPNNLQTSLGMGRQRYNCGNNFAASTFYLYLGSSVAVVASRKAAVVSKVIGIVNMIEAAGKEAAVRS